MDPLHRKPQEHDSHMGRDCCFCKSMDPEFGRRKPIDRLVHSKLDDTASAHLSEDGYVQHRLAELSRMTAAA